jgi:hypothetical protein
MSKISLPALSPSCVRHVLVVPVLLFGLAGISAQAASNQGSAVLHIQITIVPTIQAPTTQPSPSTITRAVAYNLGPAMAPKMTTQVTFKPMLTPGTESPQNSSNQSETGAILKTITLVPE